MKKNYLPSKRFIYSIVAIVILGVLFFVISSLISGKSYFSASKNGQLQTTSLTLNDLLQKSSAGDGIPDWEKALWGLDPNSTTTNGIPDAQYIQQKKDALKIASGNTGTQNNGNLTETDKFAQEFFASLSAMKQSGQVDANTINNVSAALGQKIVDPTMTDQYTDQDAKIADKDGIAAQKTYYTTIKKLFEDYKQKGIGEEVQITSVLANSGEVGNESQYSDKLTQIASAYEDYATKVMATSVPQSLVPYHIAIANSANNTGLAVGNMAKVVNDPVVGLSGLSQYQKYSDALITAVGNLETILYNNGVLTETPNTAGTSDTTDTANPN